MPVRDVSSRLDVFSGERSRCDLTRATHRVSSISSAMAESVRHGFCSFTAWARRTVLDPGDIIVLEGCTGKKSREEDRPMLRASSKCWTRYVDRAEAVLNSPRLHDMVREDHAMRRIENGFKIDPIQNGGA